MITIAFSPPPWWSLGNHHCHHHHCHCRCCRPQLRHSFLKEQLLWQRNVASTAITFPRQRWEAELHLLPPSVCASPAAFINIYQHTAVPGAPRPAEAGVRLTLDGGIIRKMCDESWEMCRNVTLVGSNADLNDRLNNWNNLFSIKLK